MLRTTLQQFLDNLLHNSFCHVQNLRDKNHSLQQLQQIEICAKVNGDKAKRVVCEKYRHAVAT